MSELGAVRWSPDGRAVDLLDQTLLPEHETRIEITTVDAMVEAIRALRVRGAPAIGIAAAMAYALEAARLAGTGADVTSLREGLEPAYDRLVSARPTAVNLRWALDRLRARAAADCADARAVARALKAEASAILEEDRAMCERIGRFGLDLLPAGGAGVLTHCNAGSLATGGMGTALAPLYLAHAEGRVLRVYADETRPLLQGSRLTAWELGRSGIDVTLVVDSVAGVLMQEGRIDLVIVGADRIAANGDVANKVGTYSLSVLARHHDVPFYVAAPVSTIDVDTPDGAAIPIEQREASEVRAGFGRATAPAGVTVYAPAFDVTPAEHVTAIITDRGVLRPPYGPAIAALVRDARKGTA
jgi:methylthioribose-1-phosphate isomerase